MKDESSELIFDNIDDLINLSAITKGSLLERRTEIRNVLVESVIKDYKIDNDFSIEDVKNKIKEKFKCQIPEAEVISTLDNLALYKKVKFNRKKKMYCYIDKTPLKDFSDIFKPIWNEFIDFSNVKCRKNIRLVEKQNQEFNNVLKKLLQTISNKPLMSNVPEEWRNLDYNEMILEEFLDSDLPEYGAEIFASCLNDYLKSESKEIKEYLGNLYQNLIYIHVFFREQKLLLKRDFYKHLDFLLLDTSFLVPLICDTDPLHRLSKSTIEYCNEYSIKLYYSSKTKFELDKVIEIAKKTYGKADAHYANQIVQDYLIKKEQDLTEWEDYANFYLDSWVTDLEGKYHITNLPEEFEIRKDDEMEEWVKSQLPLIDFSRKIYCNMTQTKISPRLRLRPAIEHDAFCISIISNRRKEVGDKIGPWFISYDNLLSAINHTYFRKKDELGYVMQPRMILSYFLGYSRIEFNVLDQEEVGSLLLQYVTKKGLSIEYDEYLNLIKRFNPKIKVTDKDKQKMVTQFTRGPLKSRLDKPLTSELEKEYIRIVNIFSNLGFQDFLKHYYEEFSLNIDRMQEKLDEKDRILDEKNIEIGKYQARIIEYERISRDKELEIKTLKQMIDEMDNNKKQKNRQKKGKIDVDR